jgi:hypothetical protein
MKRVRYRPYGVRHNILKFILIVETELFNRLIQRLYHHRAAPVLVVYLFHGYAAVRHLTIRYRQRAEGIPVAPALFCRVQHLIGAFDIVVPFVVVFNMTRRYADRNRDMIGYIAAFMRDAAIAYILQQITRDHTSGVPGVIRQHDRKLLRTVPRNKTVGLRYTPGYDLGCCFKTLVARVVTVGFVILLKTVYIDHHAGCLSTLQTALL